MHPSYAYKCIVQELCTGDKELWMLYKECCGDLVHRLERSAYIRVVPGSIPGVPTKSYELCIMYKELWVALNELWVAYNAFLGGEPVHLPPPFPLCVRPSTAL